MAWLKLWRFGVIAGGLWLAAYPAAALELELAKSVYHHGDQVEVRIRTIGRLHLVSDIGDVSGNKYERYPDVHPPDAPVVVEVGAVRLPGIYLIKYSQATSGASLVTLMLNSETAGAYTAVGLPWVDRNPASVPPDAPDGVVNRLATDLDLGLASQDWQEAANAALDELRNAHRPRQSSVMLTVVCPGAGDAPTVVAGPDLTALAPLLMGHLAHKLRNDKINDHWESEWRQINQFWSFSGTEVVRPVNPKLSGAITSLFDAALHERDRYETPILEYPEGQYLAKIEMDSQNRILILAVFTAKE